MRFSSRKPKSEFDQRLVDLARVARVVKGGRRFRFRATVVAGNRHGKIGLGTAKGSDVSNAINKAFEVAQKNIIEVRLLNKTIPYELRSKYKAAKIIMRPAKQGVGIKAGGAVRIVAELVGISNLSAKMTASRNKFNNAKAVIEAFKQIAVLDDTITNRGQRIIKSKETNKRVVHNRKKFHGPHKKGKPPIKKPSIDKKKPAPSEEVKK